MLIRKRKTTKSLNKKTSNQAQPKSVTKTPENYTSEQSEEQASSVVEHQGQTQAAPAQPIYDEDQVKQAASEAADQEKRRILSNFHAELEQEKEQFYLEFQNKSNELDAAYEKFETEKLEFENAIKQANEEIEAQKQQLEERSQQLEVEYQQSIKQGFDQGYQEARANLDQVSEEFGQVIGNVNKAKEQVLAELEPEITAIALDVASKILKRESRLDDNLIREQVLSTVRKVIVKGGLMEVSINPADMEYEETLKTVLNQILDREVKLVLSPKEDVQPGSCMVETQGGKFNASFGMQIESVKLAFEKYLGEEIITLPEDGPEEEEEEEVAEAHTEILEDEPANENLSEAYDSETEIAPIEEKDLPTQEATILEANNNSQLNSFIPPIQTPEHAADTELSITEESTLDDSNENEAELQQASNPTLATNEYNDKSHAAEVNDESINSDNSTLIDAENNTFTENQISDEVLDSEEQLLAANETDLNESGSNAELLDISDDSDQSEVSANNENSFTEQDHSEITNDMAEPEINQEAEPTEDDLDIPEPTALGNDELSEQAETTDTLELPETVALAEEEADTEVNSFEYADEEETSLADEPSNNLAESTFNEEEAKNLDLTTLDLNNSDDITIERPDDQLVHEQDSSAEASLNSDLDLTALDLTDNENLDFDLDDQEKKTAI
jgi:flagellar biosynthesis/type III secretory pathway protein FliH